MYMSVLAIGSYSHCSCVSMDAFVHGATVSDTTMGEHMRICNINMCRTPVMTSAESLKKHIYQI